MRVEVDAGGFAVALAFATVLALLGVDVYLEERLLADESEQRSDGTNRVAPSASVLPGQYCDDAQTQQGYHKRTDALEPDVNRIECVTVVMFCNRCQAVVRQLVERSEDGRYDAAISAVGEDESAQPGNAQSQRGACHNQHGVAQHMLCGRVVVLVLLPAQPGDEVLHHAKRTDDGAVDAPRQQREGDDEEQSPDVQSQQRWNELDFGHPSQVGLRSSCEVQQEPGNQHPEDDGECQTDFPKHTYL